MCGPDIAGLMSGVLLAFCYDTDMMTCCHAIDCGFVNTSLGWPRSRSWSMIFPEQPYPASILRISDNYAPREDYVIASPPGLHSGEIFTYTSVTTTRQTGSVSLLTYNSSFRCFWVVPLYSYPHAMSSCNLC